MLCVCVVDVMDVVFSVCIARRGAVGGRVCLCALCGSSQCCVLQNCSLIMLDKDAIGNHMEEAYSSLDACTEMLWMYVLYVSFVSKIRPRTFGYVAMGSALLCISGPDCSYIQQGQA